MPNRTKKPPKLDVPIGFLTVDHRWKAACLSIPPAIPHVDPAFDAARALCDGNEYVRFGLEARVLAGQSKEEIAVKTLIPCDAIAGYEHWFFAAREHLDVPGWIAREAVRRRPTGELERDDVGPFWRWVGYHFGLTTLEQLLAAVDHETLRIKGLDAYLTPGVPLDPAFKLLITIERMPTPTTPKQWNTLLRYRRALSLAVVPAGGELLTPLTMEFLPLSEPNVAVPVSEMEDIEIGFEQLCELLNGFTIKTEDVVQSQKMSDKEVHRGLGV